MSVKKCPVRKWLWPMVLLLSGCGKSPPARTGAEIQALATALADHKVYLSAESARKQQLYYAAEMLRRQDYTSLDAFLSELARRDPFDTLSTPTLILDQLLKDPKQVGGDCQFLTHHLMEEWAKTGSGWGKAAQILAYFKVNERLLELSHWQWAPASDFGAEYYRQAQQLLEEFDKKHPAYVFLKGIGQVNEARSKKAAWFGLLAAHPEETGLFQAFARFRTEKLRSEIAQLKKSPVSYAALYASKAEFTNSALFSAEGWDWPTLQTGFRTLLDKHPRSTVLRNAYALAAFQAGQLEEARRQLRQLGSHWSGTTWNNLNNYRLVFGDQPDFHLAHSDFQLPAAEGEPFRNAWKLPMEILDKGDYALLEELMNQVRRRHPQELADYYWGLSLEENSNEAEFRLRKGQLEEWQKAYPDSVNAATALALLYVNYGWFARGEGTADTVSPENWALFKQRLEESHKHSLRAYNQGGRDPDLIVNMLILCKARTADKEAGITMTLALLKLGGQGWAEAASQLTALLLPRWLGEPGEITRVADRFRKQLGHDDFYAVAGMTVLLYEGADCLQPGHESHIDWKRLTGAVASSVERKTLPSGRAHDFLGLCLQLKKPATDARLVLPALGTDMPRTRWQHVYEYKAARAWAAGRGDRPMEPIIPKFGKPGYFEWGELVFSTTPKARHGLTFGFPIAVTRRPPGTIFKCSITVRAPQTVSFRENTIPIEVFPDEPMPHELFITLTRPEWAQPGNWSIEVKSPQFKHEAQFLMR